MTYSQLLLFPRILLATETALFWQSLCTYVSSNLSIDRSSYRFT